VSVERVKRSGRKDGWKVRYRDAAGRARAQNFDRKDDAEAFDLEVRRRRRLGTLADLDQGRELLSDFVAEWWRTYAQPNLAESTRRRYAEIWDLHLLDRVGNYKLRDLTPARVEELRAELEAARVGAATIRKGMFLLQAVMSRAVIRGAVPMNPVQPGKKPRQRSREVRPLPPETVEAIRAQLEPRDARLISLMAYGGLRPGEAINLPTTGVRERTLLVHATKTNRTRTVRLLAPLAEDLREWREASGAEDGLLFPAPSGKGRWADHDFRNWRKRAWAPAAKAAGLRGVRPYALRHSFVSLLIHEGLSIAEVARQAGHSVEECVRTYVHVFEEFEPGKRVNAEDAIRTARHPRPRQRARSAPDQSA
jgi:integrase